MILNQEQWFEKIKSLIPSWVIREKNSKALFMAMAKVIASKHQELQDHLDETFIDSSSEDFLMLHGEERRKSIIRGETETVFKRRVKEINNISNLPDLKNMIDSFLIRGKSTVIEHHSASNFLNRGAFANRNIIDFTVLYNAFTIMVDHQIPEPVTFLNRGVFSDRGYLQGSNVSSRELFDSLVTAINKNKVFGTVYRLIERPN